MLTHLRIQNFKSWADTGRVRLAPITVFFGTNSSGKSSVGQLLLMLKQTAESSDRTRVLDTGDRDTAVDVGTYRDFVHHHEVSRELLFEVGWSQPRPLHIEDARDPTVSYTSERLVFTGVVVGEDRRPERMRVRRLQYALGGDSPTDAPFAVELEHATGSRYKMAFRGFAPIRTRGRPWELPPPARFYGFPDEAVAYYQNTEFLPDLSLALERMLGSLSYLGPLRVDPERVYIWAGGTPEDVGWAGERTVDALLAGGERRFNLRKGEKLRSLQAIVAGRLAALGLIHSFKVLPVAPGRSEHEVRVVATPGGDEVLLTDVGFGVSQVLPVIVQSFYAPAHSTIVMEQPELHLHPSVQKGLADFFIDASGARESGAARNTQFIIESHSEHFLRRLQRLIAEQHLTPEHVALYFCEVVRGRSTLRPLEVDLFGNIRNWPHNFFGDPMEDVVAQTEAQLLRQISTGTGSPET